MRVSKDVFTKSYEASADLSARQFCFVKPSAGVAGGVSSRIAVCGAGERMSGILQDDPDAAGIAGAVRHLGTSKLKVDGSGTPITVGLPLASGALGVGVVAVSGDPVGAIALEASTASGDIIEVLQVHFDLA